MSDAVFGKGTLMQRGDGGTPESFATIGEVQDVEGPTQETDEHEVTSHSTTGNYKEFIQGLIDAGTFTFPINYNPSVQSHQDLHTDQENRTISNYRLVFPGTLSGYRIDFKAYVRSFPRTFPANGPLKGTITLRITEKPTFVTP